MRSDAAQIIALSRSNAFGPDIEGGSIPITGALTTPSPQTVSHAQLFVYMNI